MLVVDDEEGIRFSLELILKDRFRVTTAASGEDALSLSRKQPFAFAITDLRMEGISGIEVLRELKRICPFTEVIILTAFENLESARAAVTLDAFDYLSKPFDVDHLLAVAEGARKRFNFNSRDGPHRGEAGYWRETHSREGKAGFGKVDGHPGKNLLPTESGFAETRGGSLPPDRPVGRRIEKVIRLIQSGPLRTITELACGVCLSPSRLKHRFKEKTGVSLKDHIRGRRLEKAALLLRSTPLSVKEIAFRVGYNHPTNFSRAFKGCFDSTPASYRKGKSLSRDDCSLL